MENVETAVAATKPVLVHATSKRGRVALVHCDNEFDKENLKLPKEDHTEASLLRDLIRHMALDLLGSPKESINVPYKDLAKEIWWPAPDVKSRVGLWMLSLERLQNVYGLLREYFV